MLATIDSWLRLAADRIHAEAPNLTSLDQAIGDGDHGTNMDRGFQAILAALDGRTPADQDAAAQAAAADVLRLAGKTLISTVGGASGPLYGTAFLRAAGAIAAAPAPLSPATAITLALEAAATGVAALGKATTGEKTILDALVPAAEAARATLDAGGDGAAVAAAARDGAEAGAEATVPFIATKGRASYLGERSAGHRDPGASSLAILVSALADATA